MTHNPFIPKHKEQPQDNQEPIEYLQLESKVGKNKYGLNNVQVYNAVRKRLRQVITIMIARMKYAGLTDTQMMHILDVSRSTIKKYSLDFGKHDQIRYELEWFEEHFNLDSLGNWVLQDNGGKTISFQGTREQDKPTQPEANQERKVVSVPHLPLMAGNQNQSSKPNLAPISNSNLPPLELPKQGITTGTYARARSLSLEELRKRGFIK